MANVKRSVLGSIVEMVLYLQPSAKGFEVFGVDRVGRKVILARHTDREACIADAASAAQVLANFRKKPVRLEVETEGTQEFCPEGE